MYRERRVAAIIVAAGSSQRMGFDKLFYKLQGKEVILRTIECFDAHPYIDSLVIVAGKNRVKIELLLDKNPLQKECQVVLGGDTRAASVAAGIAHCAGASIVAIHDGARPFPSAELISKTIATAGELGAAAPAIAVKDTIKRVVDNEHGLVVAETLPRARVRAVQTPQVFEFSAYRRALGSLNAGQRSALTDDCALMELVGTPVHLVEGEESNLKITTAMDLIVADQLADRLDKAVPPGALHRNQDNRPVAAAVRVGHGYDVHKLVPNRPLLIGGVKIPYHLGLLGHSDADVLLHAIADALLGAAALGDIGRHFPDSEAAYAGADSLALLEQVRELVHGAGFEVVNVDATVLCQAPKLSPHIPEMRRLAAQALYVDTAVVSVKATTEEGLGFTGSGQGIAAHCVALLQSYR